MNVKSSVLQPGGRKDDSSPGGSVPVAPAQAKPPGIATHYLRYSFSNAFVLLAGVVSFPILTRVLSNTEYGILRYYDALLLLGVYAAIYALNAFGVKLGARAVMALATSTACTARVVE